MAKRRKRSNSDLQNTTHKSKDRATETPLKTGVKSGDPEGSAVHATRRFTVPRRLFVLSWKNTELRIITFTQLWSESIRKFQSTWVHPQFLVAIRVAQSLVLCVLFYLPLCLVFCAFFLAIAVCVLRITASYCPFKLFILKSGGMVLLSTIFFFNV